MLKINILTHPASIRKGCPPQPPISNVSRVMGWCLKYQRPPFLAAFLHLAAVPICNEFWRPLFSEVFISAAAIFNNFRRPPIINLFDFRRKYHWRPSISYIFGDRLFISSFSGRRGWVRWLSSAADIHIFWRPPIIVGRQCWMQWTLAARDFRL